MPSEDPRNNCGGHFGSSSRTPVTNCLLRTECKLREVRRLKSENQPKHEWFGQLCLNSTLFIIAIRQWEPNLRERGGEKRLGLVEKALKDQWWCKGRKSTSKTGSKNLIYYSNMEAQVPETCDNLLRFFCRRSGLNTRKQTRNSLSIYQHRPSILTLTCW